MTAYHYKGQLLICWKQILCNILYQRLQGHFRGTQIFLIVEQFWMLGHRKNRIGQRNIKRLLNKMVGSYLFRVGPWTCIPRHDFLIVEDDIMVSTNQVYQDSWGFIRRLFEFWLGKKICRYKPTYWLRCQFVIGSDGSVAMLKFQYNYQL